MAAIIFVFLVVFALCLCAYPGHEGTVTRRLLEHLLLSLAVIMGLRAQAPPNVHI